MRIIDKEFCMSHYLAFRFIERDDIDFFKDVYHKSIKPQNNIEKELVETVEDIERIIKRKIKENYIPNKTAIFLSSGIDSAILASYLPAGTRAYTFKCIADGATDETEQAKIYADKYNLKHEIIEMYWSDFENLTPEILEYDGEPFHSIEVQLVKAIKHVKKQGIELIILGDGADKIFGGHNKILAKEWDFDEFKEFYTYVNPEKVLKKPVDISYVYERYRLKNKKIDYQKFLKELCTNESITSFEHVFAKEKINHLEPYFSMEMGKPLDLKRIRNGEPKYMLRELFKLRYPELEIPEKIPLPRATEQWLKNYKVSRPEFIPNCTDNLTGDQKWLVWCLEQFLNIYDKPQKH